MRSATKGDPARDVGPGVKFPPPLLFLIGLVAGLLLQWWRPMRVSAMQQQWILWLGITVVVSGFALAALSIRTFRRARVSVLPNRPARSVVTHGVYSYSRNPIYLGFCLIYVGVALMTGAVWAVVLLPVVLWVLTRTVIRKEEAHLRERFPEEYAAYCQRVRRWL